MAKIYPERPLPDTSPAELKVRRALEGLPDTWTIIHGLAWQSIRDGRPGDGEADLVAIHPAHGVVFIEVKGGGIDIDHGEWRSTDRNGNRHSIKNPFEQAASSKHALVNFLRDQRVLNGFLPAGHVVSFPDLSDVGPLGPAAPPELAWTSADLIAIRQAMDRVCKHWELSTKLDPGQIARIVDKLAPTTHVRPLLRDHVGEALEEIKQLTDEQLRVLDQLRRARRAIIYGGAGTGKTLLAVERARRLADQGFEVLLVCYNNPLGEHLRALVADEPKIVAGSFHSFARRQLAAAGFSMPPRPDQSWWDTTLPNSLPELAEQNGTGFDAVVVDEGQDFHTDWWTVLSLLLRSPDDGPFYVFADTHQALFRRGWSPPFQNLELELTTNCRNTVPIATRVAGIFGDAPVSLGARGSDPLLHVIEGFGQIGGVLRTALHRLLIEEKLRADQIVVLSASRDVVQTLRERTFGSHRIVPPGGAGIIAETIHRFKGLESDAVIVIAHQSNPDIENLLYVGLSRARAHLELICTESIARSVGWPR